MSTAPELMRAHVGTLEVGLASLKQTLGHAAQLVGALAQNRALLGRNPAHHAHEARDLALAAEQRHARLLQIGQGLGPFDHPLCLDFKLFQVIDQAHCVPFLRESAPIKKPPLGCLRKPKDG